MRRPVDIDEDVVAHVNQGGEAGTRDEGRGTRDEGRGTRDEGKVRVGFPLVLRPSSLLLPCLQPHDPVIRLRTAVAVELPGVADFADLVHVEVGDDESVLIARGHRQHLAAWIAEVALAVKLADVPWRFVADAVDGTDKVAVGDGVRGLLELPEIFGESGYGGRGIHHDLSAGETELARALGE